jgi:hypothetical protein
MYQLKLTLLPQVFQWVFMQKAVFLIISANTNEIRKKTHFSKKRDDTVSIWQS